jgi:glycosyltransferase involved in cell wall biosynthesis
MEITWITFGTLQQEKGKPSSQLASVRYRVIIPAIELSQQQHTINIVPIIQNQTVDSLLPHIKADVVIFSKSFNPINEILAQHVKTRGTKIIFDICDNHFENAKHSRHYKTMVELADKIVANTVQMAEIIAYYTNKTAFVIADPYEGPKGIPQFAPKGPFLKLLWFGHPVNLDSLQAMIPHLFPLSQQLRLELQIITAPNQGVESACLTFNQQHGQQFRLRFSAWSLNAVWQGLQETDIVVIPSLLDNRKIVKSHNRLVESLWAGRFVVAQPIPSYQEFSQWAYVNQDMVAGIQWALQNPQKVVQNISQAQNYIANHFSPEVIGKKWQYVLNSLDLKGS